MEMRTLGKCGIHVSVLGLGTVKWGRTQGLKYPNPVTLPTDSELRCLLQVARDCGMNVIDTAPAYELAEQRVGALISNRAEWVISTKFGERFMQGVSSFDFSATALRSSLDESLRRLRTDYVDVLLVHSNGEVEHAFPDELVSALEHEKKSGRVRAIGISSKSEAGGRRALAWADVLMLTLNPEYTQELDLIRDASSKGVGVLIKKALISGHGGSARRPSVRSCLELALQAPGVASVVIGSTSPVNVQNNARIADEIVRGG